MFKQRLTVRKQLITTEIHYQQHADYHQAQDYQGPAQLYYWTTAAYTTFINLFTQACFTR